MTRTLPPLFAILILGACQSTDPAPNVGTPSASAVSPTTVAAAPSAPAAPSASIRQVESKRVCMINNQLMNVDQIPVSVDGKTYFGCCPMCKERLEKDARSRAAVDPVSGQTVDKSVAVIGAKPNGSVVYFESAENLAKYASR